MTLIQKHYKILNLWISYGLTFDSAIREMERSESEMFTIIFKKHRNWTLEQLEKRYPEYNL